MAGTAQAQTPTTFAAVSTYSTGANSVPRSVAVGDVNGDGRPDLVTSNGGLNTAGVLLGQGGGVFGALTQCLNSSAQLLPLPTGR